MASLQHCKPVQQTCNQGQYYDSSLGGWAQKTHASHPSLVNSYTECTTKTQTYSGTTPTTYTHTTYVEQTKPHGHGVNGSGSTQAVPGHCLGLNQTHGYGHGHGHTHSSNGTTTGTVCNQTLKKRSEHRRRGLFQKIKDGISGGDSSSDSESDDDEHCNRRRASHY